MGQMPIRHQIQPAHGCSRLVGGVGLRTDGDPYPGCKMRAPVLKKAPCLIPPLFMLTMRLLRSARLRLRLRALQH